MRNQIALTVLEAAYHLGCDEQSWLSGLAESVRTLANSAGSLAVVYEPDPGPFTVRACAHAGNAQGPSTDVVLHAFFELESLAKLDPFSGRTLHSQTICETSSDLFDRSPAPEIMDPLFARHLHAIDVYDAFNVQGADLTGRALCLIAPCDELTTISPATRAIWRRVAIHLGAALRLRMALVDLASADILNDATAVFDARTGACAHATGDGRSSVVQETLRQAVQAVDRARSHAVREDAPLALDLWRGLFAGRFSLADVFDSDGRRHIVVHENEPAVRADRRLTRRETQAALLAADALDDAHGAYALGVSRSTFRAHLRRALRKLGMSDRAQLIEIADKLRAEERPHRNARSNAEP